MRLRIISGQYGSRFIKAPSKSSVHPMSERMRGALFNSLGPLSGKVVLDAFAGSGAVGLEALSRGAKQVTFIEKDRTVVNALRENIDSLKADGNSQVIQANLFGWAEKSQDIFDVIIADPPYDKADYHKTVDKLKSHVTKSGIVILSHSGSAEAPRVDGVVVVETRSYSNGALTFYQSQ